VLGEEIRFDEPDNLCFGCGQRNEHGFRLTFVHVAPSAVQTTYTAPEHTCGAPGVVHGGVQAVLLDEAIGFAVHAHHESVDGVPTSERVSVVTTEFDLRYRRPAPTGAPLTVRAEVVHVSGRDHLAVGEILDGAGEVLTSATARWRRIDR
jgi:uncharacterized protein (TIGR00369 family)